MSLLFLLPFCQGRLSLLLMQNYRHIIILLLTQLSYFYYVTSSSIACSHATNRSNIFSSPSHTHTGDGQFLSPPTRLLTQAPEQQKRSIPSPSSSPSLSFLVTKLEPSQGSNSILSLQILISSREAISWRWQQMMLLLCASHVELAPFG